ncbi:MAG: toprim domain-containing protein, partial [Deltaproteobacteria bacterium]|nr:toprim domain-containing protein [Deltaproteobacteria bacterium]
AAEYFHKLLMEHPAGEPARDYMRIRGYGRKAAQEYQIGYSLDAWEDLRQHLDDQGLQAEDARTLGLVRPGKQNRGDYDLFRGRLIFPIYDLSGRVVAFAGRVLDDGKPKYINSPESPIYHKGRVLFGLFQARQAMRQSGEVLLVEGYFDQLALYRAGIPQVVATCGTALTVDHARILKRYVQRVVLLFDQDEAGRKATFKAMGVLQEEGVPASVIELSDGEDPDSFVQKYGSETFSEKLAQARPVMDVFMEDLLSGAVSVEDRVRAAEKILEQISGLSSALEQDLYLKELAKRSGIELALLKQKKPAQRQPVKQGLHPDPPPPEEYPQPASSVIQRGPDEGANAQKQTGWSRAEETLLCLLVHNHIAREKFIVAGGPEIFDHPNALVIARLLLENTADSGLDIESIQHQLDPDQALSFHRLLSCDQGQFSENIDEFLSGCLTAIKRTRKKQQRGDLLVKMRQFEQAGETEKAKDLLEEFKNLK